jgi:hypothetical protein
MHGRQPGSTADRSAAFAQAWAAHQTGQQAILDKAGVAYVDSCAAIRAMMSKQSLGRCAYQLTSHADAEMQLFGGFGG